MKNKRGYIVYLAIKNGCINVKDITEYYINHTGGYISDIHIRYLAEQLRKHGYVAIQKNGKYKSYTIIKEISGPIDIKI